MAKKFPLTDAGAEAPRPMSSEQHKYFASLVSHTLRSSEYNGHGHAVGSQGPKGHRMAENNSEAQSGGYIPRGSLKNSDGAKMPQSSWSDGAGCADASDVASADYAQVEKAWSYR
jgi:hypothetical protein